MPNWRHALTQARYLRAHPAYREAPLRHSWRALLWLGHCGLRQPAVVDIASCQAVFFVPPRLQRGGSTSAYILRDAVEPELRHLDRLLSPGNVFVDGGANIGLYTIKAAKLVGPEGRVLAFEPGRQSFATLARNVALNDLANVTCFRQALSDEVGVARFYHGAGAPVSYSLVGDAGDYEEVAVTTLGKAIDDERLERLDCIKLDVEGVEARVLRACLDHIVRHRPTVIFEVNNGSAREAAPPAETAWGLLYGLGYRFYTMQADRLHEVEAIPACTNVIAMAPAGAGDD